MTESTERRDIAEERSHESMERATEWQAPTLTRLGDAVPLTMGASGTTPDGPGLMAS